MSNLSQFANLLAKMSREEMLAANKMICVNVKLLNKQRQTVAKAQFRVGQSVKWQSSRTGMMMVGRITKINPKNIVVLVERDNLPDQVWNVAATLLSSAEA